MPGIRAERLGQVRLTMFELAVLTVAIAMLVASVVVTWAIEVYVGTGISGAVVWTGLAAGLIMFLGQFIVHHVRYVRSERRSYYRNVMEAALREEE